MREIRVRHQAPALRGSHLEATGVELANVDDACGAQSVMSVIDMVLEPGSYTLIVEGYSSEEGRYTVTTSCTVAAPSIGCGDSVTSNTLGAANNVGSLSGEHFYHADAAVDVLNLRGQPL